jgi:IS5 family transposase
VGIDASGFDRSHASKHYMKRAKLTIQRLKVTLLVDTRANATLNLYITTTRKHDTQIAPFLINRNAAEVEFLLNDKKGDNPQIRWLTRENDIRPLIKHREFSSIQKPWNARLRRSTYRLLRCNHLKR